MKAIVCVVLVVVAAEASGLTETAFGEHIAHTGTDPQPYSFAGEPLDPNSGFQYHRARWMDPRVGRFTAMDPLGGRNADPIGLHRYLYAAASPVDVTDPTGLFSLAESAASLSIITTIAAMSITTFSLLNTFVSTAGGDESDAWLLSVRANVGTKGGLFAGGLDLLWDNKGGKAYVSAALEGGLSPLTLFKGHGLGFSAVAGPVFGLQHPGQLSGLGLSAVWPSSAVGLVLGVLAGKNEGFGFLTQLAKKASRRFAFEFGLSSAGPSYALVGYYSNSFQATASWNGNFVELESVPDALKSGISDFVSLIKELGSLGKNTAGAADQASKFFGILDRAQQP